MFGSCLWFWLTHRHRVWSITSWSIPGTTRSLAFNLSGVKHRFWNSDANWGLFPKKSTQRKHTQRFAFKSREFTCSWSILQTFRSQLPSFGLILVFLTLTNKILWPLQVFSECLLKSIDLRMNCCLPGTVGDQRRRVNWSKTSPTHTTSYTHACTVSDPELQPGIHWSFCKESGTKKRVAPSQLAGCRAFSSAQIQQNMGSCNQCRGAGSRVESPGAAAAQLQ